MLVDIESQNEENSPVMLTGNQICAGRGPLKLSQAELARLLEVSRDTVIRAEKAGPEVPRFLASGTMIDIVKLLEDGGWTFHVDGSLANGVRMEHPMLLGLGPSAEEIDTQRRMGFGPKMREDMARRIAVNQRSTVVGMTLKQLRALNRLEGDAIQVYGDNFDAIEMLSRGVDFFARERRMPKLEDIMPPPKKEVEE